MDAMGRAVKSAIDMDDLDRRTAEARFVFEHFPTAVQKELQEKALNQQVAVGMDPYIARIAGGSCSYRVIADPSVWPINADPLEIMNAQALRPDASRIWLYFENSTQFQTEYKVQFVAYIEKGRVIDISRIEKMI